MLVIIITFNIFILETKTMNELEKLRHDLEMAKLIIKSMLDNNEPEYRVLHEEWIKRYFEDILE